jgi:hypothetical protein
VLSLEPIHQNGDDVFYGDGNVPFGQGEEYGTDQKQGKDNNKCHCPAGQFSQCSIHLLFPYGFTWNKLSAPWNWHKKTDTGNPCTGTVFILVYLLIRTYHVLVMIKSQAGLLTSGSSYPSPLPNGVHQWIGEVHPRSQRRVRS